MIKAEGYTVTCDGPRGPEKHDFASPDEARGKAAFVTEALSWVGTPFRDCADIKGPNGAVDCAMLLTRSVVDTRLMPPFDPRPYSPRWFLHHSEEKFLEWVRDRLGGVEVEAPRFGDVIVWRFGRCFAHGAILINSEEVVHAYAHARMCIKSRLDEHCLKHATVARRELKRPIKYFDIWPGVLKSRESS